MDSWQLINLKRLRDFDLESETIGTTVANVSMLINLPVWEYAKDIGLDKKWRSVRKKHYKRAFYYRNKYFDFDLKGNLNRCHYQLTLLTYLDDVFGCTMPKGGRNAV